MMAYQQHMLATIAGPEIGGGHMLQRLAKTSGFQEEPFFHQGAHNVEAHTGILHLKGSNHHPLASIQALASHPQTFAPPAPAAVFTPGISPACSSSSSSGDGSLLPCDITITHSTDALQVGAMVNCALSQPQGRSVCLHAFAEGNSRWALATAARAVHAAVAARKLHARNNDAASGIDVAFTAQFSADLASSTAPHDAFNLHLLPVAIPAPDALAAHPQLFLIDASTDILSLGLQLAQLVVACAPGLPGPAAELIFAPAAAKTALQLLSVARLNLTGSGRDCVILPDILEGAHQASTGPLFYLRLLPSHAVIQLPSLSPLVSLASSSGNSFTQSTASAISSGSHHSPSLYGATAADIRGPPSGYSDRSGGSSPVDEPTFLNTLARTSEVSSTGMRAPLGLPPTALGAPQSAQQQQQPAAAVVAAARPKARKADWVIVTEDTAIKNAAGAIAKVLGRVASMGQCCPVFTERKTGKFTGVISVAVKAIAVARGYILNEGTGHEVGFQPYVRHQHPDRADSPEAQLLPDRRLLPPPAAGAAPGPLDLSTLLGLHAHMDAAGAVEPSGGSGSAWGLLGADGEGVGANVHGDMHVELAFDVYKIPQLPELPEAAGNLPVKVTAHSRPDVVSNIITKLVTERDSAVLITAGGKAMHVAMSAVVSARSRLRARGCDVLLLPKFVTVDTTSTLGWESVFLRFTIIKWVAPIAGGSGGSVPNAASPQPLALPPQQEALSLGDLQSVVAAMAAQPLMAARMSQP